MEFPDILLVDDDENLNFAITETLKRKDYQVEQAYSLPEAREKLNNKAYPLVITDVRMPGGSGINLVAEIKKKHPDTAVIVITAYGKVEDAVSALKLGAEDYIQKPFPAESILALVERHFPLRFFPRGSEEFLTADRSVKELLEKAQRVAASNASVLILGESGAGKEVLARYLHRNSRRHEGPFLAMNCAAIPENLLESELFGYEKGAFTGADKFKPGKFELADGGTLVLDEIGDMPLHLQAKILRVLQEKEIDRLGSRKTHPVDVRLISLSNQDIAARIAEKSFREDLYFRLNVIELTIPPLRKRPEDIILLARHFCILYGNEINQSRPTLTPEAERKLLSHSWPGNVRELQNTIHRAVIFCATDRIDSEHVEFRKSSAKPGKNDLMTVAEMEKELILQTLEKISNRTRAAEILGISGRTLRNKLKEYNLPEN